jgi:hypothetical protein
MEFDHAAHYKQILADSAKAANSHDFTSHRTELGPIEPLPAVALRKQAA